MKRFQSIYNFERSTSWRDIYRYALLNHNRSQQMYQKLHLVQCKCHFQEYFELFFLRISLSYLLQVPAFEIHFSFKDFIAGSDCHCERDY